MSLRVRWVCSFAAGEEIGSTLFLSKVNFHCLVSQILPPQSVLGQSWLNSHIFKFKTHFNIVLLVPRSP